MNTALFAWEIGGGQGHLHLLATIAHELQNHGIKAVFAVQNDNIKGLTLPGKVVKAPQVVFKALDNQGDNKCYFFTDILYMFGFSDILSLHFHLQAWQNLINIVKPSLIIADSTPALILAAKGQIPTIVVGTGFTVPPPVGKFPSLRSSPIPDDAIKRFQLVVENVKQVTGFYEALGCLLNGDRSFVFAIPELDPYADVRGKAEYMGIHSAPFPQNLWDKNGEPWAYLNDNWYYRYLVIDTFKANCNFGDLKYILKGKSFALHHASLGTSKTCLLAGIPQIVFPTDLEKSITARLLINLGVAIAILPPFTKQTLLDATAYLPQISQNAQQQARQLVYWNQNFLDKLIQSCLEIIN